MPTTTNYGWTTPADTDLVKDGASAIRTLGTAIDTTVFNNAGAAIAKTIVDAKGDIIAASAADTVARLAVGTDNQRLVAASGETTGLKYVSDTQNTVIDAEGDLLVGDSADTLQRLAIGTTGQVLTVDTTVDGKIKWATTSSTPSFVGWNIYRNANFTLNNNTTTNVSWDSETFDTDSFHDLSSNTDRVTIPSGKNGKYSMSAWLQFPTFNSTGIRQIALQKNGVNQAIFETSAFDNQILTVSTILDLVATDYITIRMYQTSGSNFTSMPVGFSSFYFVGHYLGA